MRIANLKGRAVLVVDGRALDIAEASGLPSDPAELFGRWQELLAWAPSADHAAAAPFDEADLGAPSPRPSQVFGIGLNYADHAREAGLELPEAPLVFTKFPSSVVGPRAEVALPGDTVDWEAELVVVIGRGGRGIPASEALAHVAGYTAGQDLSERTVQWQGGSPQFSLGKSYEGFAPIGPAIVTADELGDPEALRLTTEIHGVDGDVATVQDGSSDQLIFGIVELIVQLSDVVELRPGDLIFTGTPPGVGMAMDPKRFLRAGERLVTTIGGIGSIEQSFVARPRADPGRAGSLALPNRTRAAGSAAAHV